MFENFYKKNIPKNDFFDLDTGPYNFYYGDIIQSRIYIDNVISIDIKSAFPSICNIVFKDHVEFIEKMNSITDKLEKNIYISNYLKQFTSEQTQTNYLKDLNKYCKIILFSYIYNNYENIEILEYQKDGCIFSGEKMHPIDKEINSHFKFHIQHIDHYFRFNSSTFTSTNGLLQVKGKYKKPPTYLQNILIPNIIKDPFDYDLKTILNIYSQPYFSMNKNLNLKEELDHYYIFNEKYYLNFTGNKTTNISDTYAPSILQFIIYPILTILRN